MSSKLGQKRRAQKRRQRERLAAPGVLAALSGEVKSDWWSTNSWVRREMREIERLGGVEISGGEISDGS